MGLLHWGIPSVPICKTPYDMAFKGQGDLSKVASLNSAPLDFFRFIPSKIPSIQKEEAEGRKIASERKARLVTFADQTFADGHFFLILL